MTDNSVILRENQAYLLNALVYVQQNQIKWTVILYKKLMWQLPSTQQLNELNCISNGGFNRGLNLKM